MSGKSFTDDSPDPELSPPSLVGRWTSLRVITPDDYPLLFHMATSPEALTRWRFRGTTPSFDQFVSHLWDSVLAQFVTVRNDTGAVLSHLVCFSADHRIGIAYLGVLGNPSETTPYRLEGVVTFVNYLFSTFPLRKIYVETTEFNVVQFADTDGRLLQQEGQFLNHEYWNGRWWDLLIYAHLPRTGACGFRANQRAARRPLNRYAFGRVSTDPAGRSDEATGSRAGSGSSEGIERISSR